jgi:2-hydroxy-3-oxopropionate reductase
MVIAGTLGVVAEAFALAKKSGIDAGKMREALLGGFAASRVLEVHGERILKGNFKPGFKTNLFAKDLKIASATLGEYQVAAQSSRLRSRRSTRGWQRGPRKKIIRGWRRSYWN